MLGEVTRIILKLRGQNPCCKIRACCRDCSFFAKIEQNESARTREEDAIRTSYEAARQAGVIMIVRRLNLRLGALASWLNRRLKRH